MPLIKQNAKHLQVPDYKICGYVVFLFYVIHYTLSICGFGSFSRQKKNYENSQGAFFIDLTIPPLIKIIE